jgi:D-alanine transfer protein
MKSARPHLYPAIAAFIFVLLALILGQFYAFSVESRYVHIMAAQMNLESMNGVTYQRIGIQQPDLLLVYGSSEMLNMDTANRSVSFFKEYPTGFQVYEIAIGGTTCLNIAQDLAALGPDLIGKKVVISFTPAMFNLDQVHPNAYWGVYSQLHANETGFSLGLSMDLKRKIAARMLDYPDTLQDDPLLLFALQQLNANTPYNDVLYTLVLPLGQLKLQIKHLQDYWQGLDFIWQNPDIKAHIARHPKEIDWAGEIQKAQVEQENNANNNPYGVDNMTWTENYQNFKPQVSGSGDQLFINNIQNSKEWGDLEIVLQILKEMGAKPLIMSRPINGVLFAASGISSQAQQVYYNKLEQTIQAYQIPLIDFKEFTNDKYFNTDSVSHTSRKGWIYVNQTFDAFFHDKLR